MDQFLSQILPAGSAAGVALLLLKEAVAAWRKSKDQTEAHLQATLENISRKLDALAQALHQHDLVAARLDHRVEVVERELKEVRHLTAHLGQLKGHLEHVRERLALVEATVRDLRGDSNPRGRPG